MKQIDDVKTMDMHGEPEAVPVPKRGRGRPPTGCAMTGAERQKKRRERLKLEGIQVVTVLLPGDAAAGLDKFIKFKDISKDSVIVKLVRSQLMRDR